MHIAGPHARRIGGEFFCYHHIVRQMHSASCMVRLVQYAVGSVGQIVLAQRFTNIHSLRRQEGVGHAPADDEVLDLADQIVEHLELGRNLCSPDDSRDRRLGIA